MLEGVVSDFPRFIRLCIIFDCYQVQAAFKRALKNVERSFYTSCASCPSFFTLSQTELASLASDPLSIVSLLSAPTVLPHARQRTSALGTVFGTLHHDDVVEYARELWLPPALRATAKSEAPPVIESTVHTELKKMSKTNISTNRYSKEMPPASDNNLPSSSKAAFGEVASHAAQAAASFSASTLQGQVPPFSTLVLPWKDEFVCLHPILAPVCEDGSKADFSAFSSEPAHRCIYLVETLLNSIDSTFALHSAENTNR